jgi:hypothetical protein
MKETISKYIQAITKIVGYTYPEPQEILKIVKTGGDLFDVIADSNFQIVDFSSFFSYSTTAQEFLNS